MRTVLFVLAAVLIAAPTTLDAQDPEAIAEGARVWADNCTRCHNARASQERTDAQWHTIVLHMRARANLTRADADVVASFLQATNLPERTLAGAPSNESSAATGTSASPDRVESPADLATLVRYLKTLKP